MIRRKTAQKTASPVEFAGKAVFHSDRPFFHKALFSSRSQETVTTIDAQLFVAGSIA